MRESISALRASMVSSAALERMIPYPTAVVVTSISKSIPKTAMVSIAPEIISASTLARYFERRDLSAILDSVQELPSKVSFVPCEKKSQPPRPNRT